MTNPKSRKKGKTLQPEKVDKKGLPLLPPENVTFYSAQRIDVKFNLAPLVARLTYDMNQWDRRLEQFSKISMLLNPRCWFRVQA